jgi:hypothetical protein
MYALMQKVNTRYIGLFGETEEGVEQILKSILKTELSLCAPEIHSYKEAWDVLLPLRQQYGM